MWFKRCSSTKYPLAFAANTLTLSLKRRIERKSFRLRLDLYGEPKTGRFILRRAEKLSILDGGGVAYLWKIFCGRP